MPVAHRHDSHPGPGATRPWLRRSAPLVAAVALLALGAVALVPVIVKRRRGLRAGEPG